jgi:hypothetical protein
MLPCVKSWSIEPTCMPEPDLDRVDAALVARRPAGALQELREALLEGHAAGLERDGVNVRDVVADNIHADLVIAQARDTGEQGAEHRGDLLEARGARRMTDG